MAAEAIEPIERWMAKRRVALVVSLLKDETSVAEAARTHGLTVAGVEAGVRRVVALSPESMEVGSNWHLTGKYANEMFWEAGIEVDSYIVEGGGA